MIATDVATMSRNNLRILGRNVVLLKDFENHHDDPQTNCHSFSAVERKRSSKREGPGDPPEVIMMIRAIYIRLLNEIPRKKANQMTKIYALLKRQIFG